MPVHERRQHFRIDDQIYFDYRIISGEEPCSDLTMTNLLLGENGKKFMEASHYFQNIDNELSELTQEISSRHPETARSINLLNAKIDYLCRQLLMSKHIELHTVNISLGGMAFKTPKLVANHMLIKVVLYTKPKMIPIIIDGRVIYSQPISDGCYRTSVAFNNLTNEQEQLLSQHILLAQVKNRAD